MMRLAAAIVTSLLVYASPTLAKGTPGEARFPASVSEQMLRELVAVGRVAATVPLDPEAWLRWGGAPIEHQESAMSAVVDALTVARPTIDVAAAILAIARVESGWNPYSRNPTSTACGLFQFVRATWESYGDSQERCFDPRINASTGVKHLMMLYRTRVAPRIAPLTPITTEAERVEWMYRMLYAYHYHGEASPAALAGGTVSTQMVADAGLSHLQGVFAILKKATTVPPVARRPRPRLVHGRRHHARTR
jgi:hypothetical protein